MSAEKLLEALKRDRNRKTKPKRLVTREEGKYKLRILPNQHSQDGLPYERVFLHFGFTHPNYNTPSTFRCLGKDCPLCRESKKMKEAGDASAWRFKSTPVYLYYVADSNGNFRFIRLTQTAHTEVVDELSAKAMAKINAVDLDTGRMAELRLSKTDGNKNKWKCSFLHDVNSVSTEIRTELSSAPALSELYRRYTKEELEKIVSGEKLEVQKGDVDSDEDEDSRPVMSSVLDEGEKQKPIDEDSIEARKARIRAQLESED
jgi:hypothetical protein